MFLCTVVLSGNQWMTRSLSLVMWRRNWWVLVFFFVLQRSYICSLLLADSPSFTKCIAYMQHYVAAVHCFLHGGPLLPGSEVSETSVLQCYTVLAISVSAASGSVWYWPDFSSEFYCCFFHASCFSSAEHLHHDPLPTMC